MQLLLAGVATGLAMDTKFSGILCLGLNGLVGALVFGLHAVHSEVVSGVVGRAELFAFVFGGVAVEAGELLEL